MPAKKMNPTVRWLKGIDRSFLMCRGLRHQWEPVGKFRGLQGEERQKVRDTVGFVQVVELRLTCRRCSALRSDLFGRTAESKRNGGQFRKIRTRYGYPDDYVFVGAKVGGERPRSGDYYQEMYRRLS